jgi:endonuclease YncB( thermonuclease family)
MRTFGIVLAFLLASNATAAETLSGRVIGISDGDTLTVLVKEHQVKVRINGIDAPEKGQAFAEQSKQNLAKMAFQRDARLECHKKDQYGRDVCKVWVQPSETIEDRGRYESSENEARLRRLGLWNDPAPIPPWECDGKNW